MMANPSNTEYKLEIAKNLTEECPGCDDPDPKLVTEGDGDHKVRCQSCGEETETFRSAMRYEAPIRAVTRWNNNCLD